MLIIYQGNRLERLAQRLSALASESPLNPLDAQHVVVPNVGLGRWLKLQLAGSTGICANLHTELPGAHAWRMFRKLLSDVPRHSAYEPPVLAWRLFGAVEQLCSQPGFDELEHYLADADPAMRFELSEVLAVIFDQYLVYRPEWISQWEAGQFEADNWQAALWQALSASGTGDIPAAENQHWVGLLARARDALNRAGASDALAAPSIVFGVAALSPAYLDFLAQLARVQDVHLFVPSPCQEYWGDVVAERDLARLVKEDEAAEYFETGNPLLSSLGAQGRDFFDQLAELAHESVEDFQDPGVDTALHRLQSEILNLQSPGAASQSPDVDSSIQFHACHSPLRELEVAHDRLLALFEQYPDLQPGQVLMMSPDINAYAPFVESVFGACPPAQRLPFRVLDANSLRADSIAGAFMAIVQLASGRFQASSVLGLFECPAVRRRFAVDESDLPQLHDWIRDTGIRWGLDGAHREKFGLEAEQANTWRAGLDAMLLGMSMAPDAQEPIRGIIPYPEIEGDGTRVLGGLAALVETLGAIADTLAAPASTSRWAAVAQRILERCFAADLEEEAELNALRDCIIERARETAQAELREDIPFSLFIRGFDMQLLAANVSSGFPSGAISVTSLQPLRSVPFRVIYLLGMNDDAFPRRNPELGLDLMSASPQRGDRSRREDDRYLFLETLQSARDALLVSFLGQDVRSNESLPPCVLVSELLDYLERSTGSPWPVTSHPLQAFSRRYFDCSKSQYLFSYRTAHCSALAQSGQRQAAPPALFSVDPDSARAAQTPGQVLKPEPVALEHLLGFARNPARAHLSAREIRLPLGEDALLDDEPFVLQGLERWQLADSFARAIQAGENEQDLLVRARAGGALPHGHFGELQSRAIYQEQRTMLGVLEQLSPGSALPDLHFDLVLGRYQLQGHLSGLRSSGLAQLRAGKTIHGRALGPLWIQHLVLNALDPGGITANTVVVTPDKNFLLPAMEAEQAQSLLLDWLDCYRDNQLTPVPLLVRSSYTFADVLPAKGADEAIDAALAAWDGNLYQAGEREDIWVKYLYRNVPPFDEHFAALACDLYLPMLEVADEGTTT